MDGYFMCVCAVISFDVNFQFVKQQIWNFLWHYYQVLHRRFASYVQPPT